MYLTEQKFNKYYIKSAIKEKAACDKLKEACSILAKDTNIPDYTWYSFSNGSISPRYFIFMVNYLSPHLNLYNLFKQGQFESE